MASRNAMIVRPARTSLDQERENFEKTQTAAIVKAMSETEAPVKTKHARIVIIGTFQERSGRTFWSIIFRLPIQSNPILAWKFCHVLHKVLREGHPNALKESQRHREILVDNGNLWGHLKEGYGKLIHLYTRLLTVKLDFHVKNPRFPGSLAMTDDDLERACESDVNNYFQLSVELLDYMGAILALQAAVFGSLDMSRSNSMTNAGQCRLAPLIPCIQDSSHIYDFIVKLLFRLHNCLPADTLVGHRDRFVKQYRALRQFYAQSSTLQYFKTLIQIPQLDEKPPNFLISSNLRLHVTPVVVVPSEPAPAAAAAAAEATLVSFDAESVAESVDGTERSVSPDLLVERDRYIEHLLHQIEQMTAELHRLRSEAQRQTDSLRQTIVDLELRLAEKESELQEAVQGRDEVEEKLSQAAQSAQLGSVVQLQLQQTEKRNAALQEKFQKLRDVYQKLRDEHIGLLRQKAETDKRLVAATATAEQSQQSAAELQTSLEQARDAARHTDQQMQALREQHEQQERTAVEQKEELVQAQKQLQDNLETVQKQVSSAEAELTELRLERANLQETCSRVQEQMAASTLALTQSGNTNAELAKSLEDLRLRGEEAKRRREEQLSIEQNRSSQLEKQCQEATERLQQDLLNAQNETKDTATQLQQVQQQLDQVKEEKDRTETRLAETIQALEQSHRQSDELRTSLERAETEVKDAGVRFQEVDARLQDVIRTGDEEQQRLEAAVGLLQKTLDGLEVQVGVLQERNVDLERQKEELMRRLEDDEAKHRDSLQTQRRDAEQILRELFVECATKSRQLMERSVANLSKPPVAALTVQDDEDLSTKTALEQLDQLGAAVAALAAAPSDKSTAAAVAIVFPQAQAVTETLLQAHQLAHTLTDIEQADQVLDACRVAGGAAAGLFERLAAPLDAAAVDADCGRLRAALRALHELQVSLLAELKGRHEENVGRQLEDELEAMERAIVEATERMAQLWRQSRQSHSGVKLEVSDKILDSCSALMNAIIKLIAKAKTLQEEIVARGKGSATATEFYKRNHQWTEGLLSAAKAVGFGAKLLTDAADKVVQGSAKFEQLTVASQEISASTAQLVFASRVKAEPQSVNLRALTEASKDVSNATGGVVAAAKHCAQLVEESEVLDFAKLTLHQAKRLEMESQVKVLELESSLDKERLRLAALRRQHYQLAGESAP